MQTLNGPIRGIVDNTDGFSVLAFYGVPFAQPPVNENRFRRPFPLNISWTEPIDCTIKNKPTFCVQMTALNVPIGQEDCLYLDIYVPLDGSAERPLPVMFWIFGGGYTIGDGLEFGWYDGKRLAHEKQVIVVNPNYRVNIFGFLALPELQNEDETKSTGNQGLQDQQMALRWTNSNIHFFKGDVDRITIFGESAGAFSVCWHLVSPSSKGLFSHAIMESGTCSAHEFFQPLDRSIAVAREYIKSIGCEKDILQCIRSKPAVEIGSSLLSLLNPNWPNKFTHPNVSAPLSPIMPFGPAIDGSMDGLIGFPQDLIQMGQFHKVPIVLGTNSNEGSIFLPMVPFVVPGTLLPLSKDNAFKSLSHFFNASTAHMAMSKYTHGLGYDSLVANILTDYFFACATRRAARAFASHGVGVYLYQFEYKMHWIDSIIFGDTHTTEIDFVWDNPWPPLVSSSQSSLYLGALV